MPHVAGYALDQIETGATLPPDVDTIVSTCTSCGRHGVVVPLRLISLLNGALMDFPKLQCAECFADLRHGIAITARYAPSMAFATSGGQTRAVKVDGIPNPVRLAALLLSAAFHELSSMVETDPHRGTEFESAFLDAVTRPRARELGSTIDAMVGFDGMVKINDMIRARYGQSARALEAAWHEIGQWRG